MKVLFDLFGLFGFHQALHVDDRDVAILLLLTLLVLVLFENHFVFAVDHFGRMHLVIKFVRVPQLGLQTQFF